MSGVFMPMSGKSATSEIQLANNEVSYRVNRPSIIRRVNCTFYAPVEPPVDKIPKFYFWEESQCSSKERECTAMVALTAYREVHGKKHTGV